MPGMDMTTPAVSSPADVRWCLLLLDMDLLLVGCPSNGGMSSAEPSRVRSYAAMMSRLVADSAVTAAVTAVLWRSVAMASPSSRR